MGHSTECRTSECRIRSESSLEKGCSSKRPDRLCIVGTKRAYTIRGSELTIGSAPTNQLVLSDRYVSKHHCRLSLSPKGTWIEDLHSRNGTWVDGLRIKSCRLEVGARISLGHTSLRLLGKKEYPKYPFGIVGESSVMQQVFEQIERLGPTLKPVVIHGESGTGKELVAKALHNCSSCCDGPFEPLNCSAIPRELAETELFGYAKGAYTGASQDRRGAFERANGGTLFLDEIGEMPLELQPKLLRVLEDGLVRRVGEEIVRPVKVRIIAASHRDLNQEIVERRFRLDLFYRIAVGMIELPALRDRVADIPLLVEHLLMQCEGSGPLLSVTPEALLMLKKQRWPGNVRELRNALERAAAGRGPLLDVEDFDSLPLSAGGSISENSLDQIVRGAYIEALEKSGGSYSGAARHLNVPKSTFYDNAKRMGL